MMMERSVLKWPPMTPEQSQQLQAHVKEIAQLLYNDAQAKGLPMNNLTEIKMAVSSQLLRHVSPELGFFLSAQLPDQTPDTPEP
jgi:hypothetical protein